MDPAARLLRMLSLLEGRPLWAGPELAERLAVTTRTVRRDVARLRDLGYPVDTTPEGYRLGVGGRLPPLLLDDDEAVAVAVGLRFASVSAVSGVEESSVAALAKLEGVMAPGLRERVRDLQAASVQMRPGRLPTVNPEVLVTLARACRAQEGVRFGYQDFQGRQTWRFVEPLQTVHSAGRWYLVGRDHEQGEWRTFRVDRVHDTSLSGHRFEFDDPPDPIDLVARATRVNTFALQARLLLELSPADARALLPASLGVIEEGPAGRAVLLVGANDLASLTRFVAGLAVDVEVLDPPELRLSVTELGRRLAERNTVSLSEKSRIGGQDPTPPLHTVPPVDKPRKEMLVTTGRLFGVTVHAQEVEETADFYREVVGLRLEGERHGDGALHYHAWWDAGDAGLMFSLFPGASQGPQNLGFLVADIDSSFALARERGVTIEVEPRKNDVGSPPGWRDGTVRDPAGNLVMLYQAG